MGAMILVVLMCSEYVYPLCTIQFEARRTTSGVFVCVVGSRHLLAKTGAWFCRSVLCRNYRTLKNLFHQGRPIPWELFTNASVSLS